MESERCVVLVFPFSTFFWLLIVMVEDSELTVLFDSLRYLSPAAAFAARSGGKAILAIPV